MRFQWRDDDDDDDDDDDYDYEDDFCFFGMRGHVYIHIMRNESLLCDAREFKWRFLESCVSFVCGILRIFILYMRIISGGENIFIGAFFAIMRCHAWEGHISISTKSFIFDVLYADGWFAIIWDRGHWAIWLFHVCARGKQIIVSRIFE